MAQLPLSTSDGDDLPAVVRLDLAPNVPLVDFVAQTGDLFLRVGLERWVWVTAWATACLRFSFGPLQRRAHTPAILPFCGNSEQRKRADTGAEC